MLPQEIAVCQLYRKFESLRKGILASILGCTLEWKVVEHLIVRPMSAPIREDILIMAKTYPSPSAQYRDTTCVAGISGSGQMRRIFPVPFRLLGGDKKFR